ncbi:hypothetical protein QP028_08635 [Corynebacterium suedekumii]|nr:hypothetical protein QP028_08635 [Corynebacterium suedekumii]
MKKLLTRPDLPTTGDHGAEPADSPADATTVAHTPTSPTAPGQGSHRSMWMRLHSYVAEPWQRLADLTVIALVCAVSGLPYPILTALAVGIALLGVPAHLPFPAGHLLPGRASPPPGRRGRHRHHRGLAHQPGPGVRRHPHLRRPHGGLPRGRAHRRHRRPALDPPASPGAAQAHPHPRLL